ncbi:response regulator [Pelagicoccus albus]|uniref:Response regulator n=1 Tax=Pelagicoccus albus TaxID=415222 RepID=A0A7X1B6G3_9BACT|nr:response regulator [Pelagicoccus albus]MBC2606563.1 response regulator [Pelagicoccus albus]
MPEEEKGKILIIDDEDGIRAVLKAILESIDIQTLEASNARSALEVLEENKQSIAGCLLDMNLEDSYGEDLYDKLRTTSPDLTVFAMSGIFGAEIRERLGERVISGFIAKPFTASDIIQTVQAGLEKRTSSEEQN